MGCVSGEMGQECNGQQNLDELCGACPAVWTLVPAGDGGVERVAAGQEEERGLEQDDDQSDERSLPVREAVFEQKLRDDVAGEQAGDPTIFERAVAIASFLELWAKAVATRVGNFGGHRGYLVKGNFGSSECTARIA